jgi:hypothetical protein
VCDLSLPGTAGLRAALLRSAPAWAELCAAAAHAAAAHARGGAPPLLARVGDALHFLLAGARAPGYAAGAALLEGGAGAALARALPALAAAPRAQVSVLAALADAARHPAAAARAPPALPAALADWLAPHGAGVTEGALVAAGSLFNALVGAGLQARPSHARDMARAAEALADALDRARGEPPPHTHTAPLAPLPPAA